MKKTKFLPYLAKRAFRWFITLVLVVAIIVGLRVCWQNSWCRDINCSGACGKTLHPELTPIHGCD